MRFMLMVIQPDAVTAAKGVAAEAVTKMMAYKKELQKAGVLLALDGLLPASAGARISYADGKPTVTDGPYAATNESVFAYLIIEVRSREEAIEWAKRARMSNGEVIEVRQIYDIPDFPGNAPGETSSFLA